MGNDFLHKINISELSKEMGLTTEEIANLAGISDPKNLGKWGQGKPNGSRPNYNAFVKLLQNGATVETLFGVNYSSMHPNENTGNIRLTDEDISRAFLRAAQILGGEKKEDK